MINAVLILAIIVTVLLLYYIYFRSPEDYDWIGGERAGYVVTNFFGQELYRVWSEEHAKQTIKQSYPNPEWLVENVLKSMFPQG